MGPPSDDPSHHERTLLPRSYISLPERVIRLRRTTYDYIYVSICGFVYFVVIVYLVFVVCLFVCYLFKCYRPTRSVMVDLRPIPTPCLQPSLPTVLTKCRHQTQVSMYSRERDVAPW